MTSLIDHLDDHTTVDYKTLDGSLPISFDVYFPSLEDAPKEDVRLLPTVIYFHAGGLTVGSRESWFPNWLQKRVNSLGFVFISADYQLLPPSTAHDIVKDIQDLFSFITRNEIKTGEVTFKADGDRIAVCGSSAGGLCAYLAVMNCRPKPKALVSLYGMGGNFFTPHYLTPKSGVFFRGREPLSPSDFESYLYPFTKGPLPRIADSPRAYHPQTYHIPNYPANERQFLPRLYLQLGIFIDYYTGMHEPSLSEGNDKDHEEGAGKGNHGAAGSPTIPTTTVEDYKQTIPSIYHSVFPQLADHRAWPPSLLLHGTADTAVPVEDSRNLLRLLKNAGVPVEIIELEGQEHSFDYQLNAEGLWKEQFDCVKEFLDKCLRS
ncbi:Alpha/Beta hydrolase protein [Gymnopilus junonius]|uniref:Alpha/Beta hydrolase protein n=1 Tax=Gymnopilus junonius TaxID=109634 RepID=A0A9P5NEH9_GYMJU|nr:Alpha/Beta hydrolase protein [Gymnopilus junonius]